MSNRVNRPFFDLLHLIGQGGQADVLLARMRILGGHFACKMLREFRDPLAREQFKREGVRQHRIASDHVVRVIAQNFDAERPFIILEYMPKGSLADEIKRRARFPLAEALSIVRRVAVALADLHAKRVVHCDLKPGNILIAPDGSLKLNDLGLAATIDLTQHVRAPGFVGTPAYAAPEQWKGIASAKSDVFALGVILGELLLGTPSTASLLLDGGIPIDVRMLIARLCAEDAAQRPTSAEAVALLDEAIRTGAWRSSFRLAIRASRPWNSQRTQEVTAGGGLPFRLFLDSLPSRRAAASAGTPPPGAIAGRTALTLRIDAGDS
jgi:serine/threonine protein kinase